MPFKSTKQIAKFGELVKEGKMSKETFDRWMKETPNAEKLPEKVEPKFGKYVKTVKVIK